MRVLLEFRSGLMTGRLLAPRTGSITLLALRRLSQTSRRLAQPYDDKPSLDKIMKKYEAQFEIAKSVHERRKLSSQLDKEIADIRDASSTPPPSDASKTESKYKSSKGKKRKFKTLKVAIWGFLIGAAFSKFVPAYTLYDKYVLGTLPTDPISTEEYITALENQLQNLDVVKQLYQDPRYLSFRAWENLEANSLKETMVNSTLATPGGFAVEPLIFLDPISKESVTIMHVGRRLCGYPMLVHGGILATILDENLKRCSLTEFKQRYPTETARMSFRDERSYANIHAENLTLQYRFPTLANRFIVIRAKCVGATEDSVEVQGLITTTKGRPLVKGTSTLTMNVKSKPESTRNGWFWH
ncbi:unnamed protein product [Kuraishia capsulata CBS 1993]|uniref:Thioesterase domain-containing protein n=1 Tax=Kuraishia capsulata CBS 1993 TaxID=1382522 RepID=W6MKU2_9ASCO|nr:uncharacterized protein KUCA_T00002647001 [Kuraishia capsulata CBS 1993]CDK26673.1 unnamed protein product [Kuraishia capsulata CBS 1993]